jgi:hypothetical protein
MNPIARTFYNSGLDSNDYEPHHDFSVPRDIDQEENTSPFESGPLEEERTDYSYDPGDDLFLMYLNRKLEENY